MSLNPLTPEEKAIGKDNFYAAIGSPLTRRDFLGGSLAAGAISGVGLGAFYFGYGTSIDNPLRVGVIGTGDEGQRADRRAHPSYVQVVAIADIRPYNIHRAFHGDHSSPAIRKVRSRPDDQVWLEDRRRSPEKRQGLRHRLPRPAQRSRRRRRDHRAAAAPASRGRHRGHEGRQARADRKADGAQRRQVQEHGPRRAQEKKLLATGHQRHYSILYDNAVDTIRAA